jgi:lipopolysaccharide assembly outer membrane protein LptD (OstA)
MKKRVYLMGAIIATCLNIARAQEENIVELDLNTDTLTSTQGADIKYGNMKMKAFNLRRDEAENKVYSPEKIFIEVDGELGKLEVDTESAVVTLDGENGEFSKTFGAVEVGKLTGAEVPNDKIYFGGKSVEYKNSNIYIKNGWATTDPSIVQTRNPDLAGYHFLSNSIEIEPDKQMTLRGSDLYIGKTDIIPFNLPWFRVNIRKDSMVPLFPTIGTEDECGISRIFNRKMGKLV